MLRNAIHTFAFSRFNTEFSSSFVHKNFPLICFENSFKRMNNLLGKHPLLSVTGISTLLKTEVQKIDLEKNSHLFLAYIIYNHQYGMCIVYVYVHKFSFSRTKVIILSKLWKNILVIGNALQLKTFKLFSQEDGFDFMFTRGHTISCIFREMANNEKVFLKMLD